MPEDDGANYDHQGSVDDAVNAHNGKTGVTKGSHWANKWRQDARNGVGSPETYIFLKNLGYTDDEINKPDECDSPEVWKENASQFGGCVNADCGDNATWDDSIHYSKDVKCFCDNGYERENGSSASACVDICRDLPATWDGSQCVCDDDQKKLNSRETDCIKRCKGDDSGSGTTLAQTWDGTECVCDDDQYFVNDNGVCEERCPKGTDASNGEQHWDVLQEKCVCSDGGYRMVGVSPGECREECSDGLDYVTDETTWDGTDCTCASYGDNYDAVTKDDTIHVTSDSTRACMQKFLGTVVWQQIESSWDTCQNWSASRKSEDTITPTHGIVKDSEGNLYKREAGDRHPCDGLPTEGNAVSDSGTYDDDFAHDQYSELPPTEEYEQVFIMPSDEE